MRAWRRGRGGGDEGPPGEPPGDAELVRAARTDKRAFDQLASRYETDLLRYCAACLGDWHEAADAAQQVLFAAYTHLPGFEDRGDSFRRWLFTIAHHEVVARRKKRGRRPEEPLPSDADLADPDPSPEEHALRQDEIAELHRYIAQLSGTSREVCELRLAGFVDTEIAKILKMSHGAVRTAQSRAVRRLRELMGVPAPPKGGRDA